MISPVPRVTRGDSSNINLPSRQLRASEIPIRDSTIKDFELKKLFLNMDKKLKTIDTEKLKEITSKNKPIIEKKMNESLSKISPTLVKSFTEIFEKKINESLGNISPTLVKSFTEIFMEILRNINTHYSKLIDDQNIALTSIINEKNEWEQKHDSLERKLNKLKGELSAPTVLEKKIPNSDKFSKARGKKKRKKIEYIFLLN